MARRHRSAEQDVQTYEKLTTNVGAGRQPPPGAGHAGAVYDQPRQCRYTLVSG